jgi:tetratricopeptide (TPR) repeat protein
MSRLRPIAAFVLGSALLPACVAPPAKPQMTITPFTEIRHAADNSAAAQYELGKYYQARGNLDLALGAYVQALTLDSRHLESRNALATIYSQKGRFAEAESTLREVVAQSPGAAYLHNNLGYVQYLEGNHEAAIKELRIAISLDPKNEWALNNLQLAQAALARRSDSLAEHTGTAPAQSPTTVAAFEIWGEVDGLDATKQTTARAGVRTESEIAKAIVPDGAAKAEAFAQIETALALKMPVAEIPSSAYEFKPKISVQPLELDRLPSTSMQTSVVAAGGDFRLEVSNGNGVTGLAKRVSHVLGLQGIPVRRLTNQQPYRQTMTEIQYRNGFEQEAEKLKQGLHGYAIVARVETLRPRVDVRIVLGKDINTHMAEIETAKTTHVAISKSATE